MRIGWQIVFWLAALAFLVLLLWLFNGVIMPFAAAFVMPICSTRSPIICSDGTQPAGGDARHSSASSSSSRSFWFWSCRCWRISRSAFIQALPDLLNKLQV